MLTTPPILFNEIPLEHEGNNFVNFWTLGALGSGQILPKIYHFPEIFSSRTINVYIEYIY
jgi:hypothetical protein